MPNKKKKAKEDAIELLKRKAANNGLKNQAQQGARTAKLNTTTTKDNVSTTTSQTGKPSTEAKKSFSNGLKGSQRANTGVNTNSRWNVKKASRYDDNFATTTTRTKGRTNRRTDRYDSDFANRRPTTSGRNHAGNTIAGAVKQWVGGQISSVGTTTQELETTARSYNKAKFEGGNDNYSLRSRADAEKARESRNRSARLKEGINLKTAERVYGNYPNSLSRRIIGAGDSLIEKGTRDINKAKEGLGSVGKLAVDLGANATQMAGDRMMAFVPGIGQALAMGSLMNRAGGTASYEARQLGMNPDQQFIYQQGTALIEGLSEGIFNSVSAFRSTYGKGAFSLADRVSTRAAASNIVQNVLKTDFGKSFAVNLSRLGAEMFEEGIEEVVADLAEPALKYALMKSTDPTTQWEGYNPKDIAYDFLVGALMAGLPGGVDVARNISSDIAMSQAYADGQAHADNVISQGLVQNRVDANGKMVKTDAEVLASQLQHQRAQGKDILPSQTRMLERAIDESSEANARAFEQRSAENEQRAIEEGTLRRSTGTYAEEAAYSRGERTVEDKNTEKAKAVMGENPSESSATAVGRVLTGTATNDDIDTILTDSEARKAVETLTGETLSANNSTARQALENIISINEIANKDAIREEVQRTHVEDIAAEINMSKRGGDIFAKNYGEAVSVIGNPSVYEDVFTRLYANGSVKESNFEEAYNRLVLQRGGAVAQYFTEAKAREAFNAGRMAMITENGKISAKAVAEKASQKPSGITFEGEAKSKLSDKQINALTKFAERANVHIRVVETMSKTLDDGTVLSANGAYKDGTIYIAADADNKLITVAKHELTHHIKKMSPERYQELEDFVFQKWYNSDTEAMEDEIRKKQLLYADITVEEAREEIIADASEAFFTDEGAVQEVMSFSEKLGRAIHDGIKTLLDTFLDLQDSDNLSKRGYGDFLDDIGILRDAERMWLEALEDSRERARGTAKSKATEKSEAKHSLKETDKEYLDAVKAEDWDKVREMVDKAAKEAGYTVRAYHGTSNFGFNKFSTHDKNGNRIETENGKVFGDGFYFTDNRDVAEKRYANVTSRSKLVDGEWVTEKTNRGVYDVYLDLGNNYVLDWNDTKGMSRRDFDRLLNNAWKEHNSLTIRNIKDGIDIPSTVYVVEMTPENEERWWDTAWSSSRIKSADLVVRDDSGEIIPLSQRFNKDNNDIRYSLKEQDQAYMDAVNKGDMETAQRMVDEQAVRNGWKPRHLYHGTLAYGFTFFDKSKARVGGNSGAGFYFSTEEDDSVNHYQDIEGADNYFKWSALADKIQRESVENGGEVISYSDAVELAKAQLNENPGTYNVYLKYDNPYIRNGRNSTDIKEILMRDFDESIIDRNDYEDEDDYEDDLRSYQDEHLYESLFNAVSNAMDSLDERYENVEFNGATVQDIVNAIFESFYDYDQITWEGIKDSIYNELNGDGIYVYNSDWTDDADGTTELVRTIIENLGFDAIVDKEVSQKFGQLSREMMTDTEHIIVFNPNQIKSATPVTYDDQGNVIPLSERFNQENEDIRYSLSSSFEAVGCDIRKENGLIRAYDGDGNEVKSFKPSDIRRSPLGRLLTLAANKKILSDSDVTQQADFLSRLYNMILNTQDPDLIWAVSGTIGYDPKHSIGKDTGWLKEAKSKFASITGNADPQYKTTIDFTTICVKTQAIIDAMSKVMIDLGRGLTEHEIIDIVYKETARAGEQVPCPVCYVFSRWVGLGNLFGKIKEFQQDYPEDMDMTAVRKEYESIKKEVDKLVKEQTGKKSSGKARDKLYKETIERKDLLDLKDQMPNKKLTEAERKELEDLNRRLEILDHWSWLEKTRLADDYKAVPDDVLFDLNAGRTFATDYPATWRFRTTRGPALGKAVAPYSPSRLGDTIRGIASPSTLAKLGNSNRVFLNKNGLTKTARNAYNKAIDNAKRQNRMNGQRLQSTSDFRFEYGLDYLLSFIELEAIGAKAQMYTKVPEAVKFLASTGTEVNCSIMAKGSGLDEKGELVFSDITGMSWEDALMLSQMYDNVQPILVAIGREHLIKAMAHKAITMIIPYHASGSSEDRYRSMMEAVGEAVEDRTDFAEYENEHDREDATPEQKVCRKLRIDILTGKFENKSLDDKEQAALKNNKVLHQLYIRIYGKDADGKPAKPNRKYVENYDGNGNDADCLGVYLTKEQAGVMMPYEYWDKHSTIKDADEQGKAYIEYCESLGITPVFSGWDSKGRYHADMDFTSYPGYWKTLIDRCMYNNDGTYHKQQAVNVRNVDLDMLDSNAMKDGIFKPMQTQDAEKTQTIAERSKARIAEEESESKFSLREDIVQRLIDERKQKANDGEQMSFFGSLNETLPRVPKQKTPAQMFYEDVLKTMAEIKSKGGWTGLEIYQLLDNTIYGNDKSADFHFIERLNDKDDDTALPDFNAFLSLFTTEEDLSDYKWYFSRYRFDKYWMKSFRSGKMKFNKAIDKRAEEIKAGKVGGRDVGVEKRDYTTTEARALFNELNTDKELKALGKKVFDCIDKNFNVRYQGVANIKGFNFTEGGTMGLAGGRTINLNMKYFNSPAFTDQQKASTLLHESIHAVTVYAINIWHGSDPYQLSFEMRTACNTLDDVYDQIRNDRDFRDEYGIKSVKEMVAELSNPVFRAKLKAKQLYERIVNAIKKIFGIETSEGKMSAYDAASIALDTIIANADSVSFERYANRVSILSDGKYQLKDNSTDSVAYKSTIAKLEDQVKDLKAEFKRTDLKTADPKQVRIQAGKLIKRHDSNMSLHGELQDTFNKIFRLYKENGEKAFDEVYEIAKNEAVSLVNGIGFIHDEGAEEYKAIKDYLRTTPITISEDMKKNITDYNDFRKRYFGKIKLVNGEQSNIDNVYMELAEMFPEQFTEDYVNPADQLYHMADVLDNYAPYYETLDGASPEMQDYVVEIASDIMETAYGLQTKKTFADKKYEEKIKAVQKAREKALETRNKALDRQKKRYEEKISALKEKNADYKEQTRENAEKKRRIKQISNIYKRLNEKLMTPSDTKHLPDGYAQIVAKVLKMFDFTTPGMEKWAERNGEPSKRYKYMSELRKQLDEMSKEESGMEIDSDLIDLVDELMADIGENDRLADLDSRVLEDIATLFRAFEHQINSYNKAFDENNKQNIAESAYRVFDDISSTKKAKWRLGVMGRLMTSNFNPSDFFTLVGGEVEELYSATRKGFDRYVSHLSDAKDFIQDTVKAKTADKWANHTGKYKTASGEEIALTDAQLMGLYCLSRREQAQNHIYFGGIISAPVKAKGRVIAKTLEEKRVIPTQEDLAEWFKKLSPEQMNVAEKIQKYLSTEPAEWGNETSMKLYGYRKFNEQMYYPIQSSKDYLDSNFDGKGTDPTLKNISPTKATVRNANNAIVVDDIFTVFSKHIAQMASYNAYVPAITDFQRVWNYTEGNDRDKVKAKFADAYGRNAANYIEDFFKNLNGVYKNNFDAGIFDKGLGLFKKAAVGGNIRVLVQQPTAIARAALIINPVYLTASVPKTAAQARKVYGEMMEHCPIAKWKSWGFYSSDITSASRDLRNIMIGKDALTDKVFMDMYGVADNATWTVIFNACKMQVEAKNKGIKKGSDEYWEKVNELASEVFDRTQVVDSPFHRSAIMKSQDKGIKMVTAFMAEPTKTVNMINTEMTLAARAVSEGHPAKAAGVFARVGMVVTANAALLAVAQALVDAMRGTGGDDDKDKGKYKDRFKAYWKEDFVDNVNLFGMIPFVKDVKSLWDGYDIARMDMNGIQKVIQSIQYLKKYYANPDESKYTKGEEWRNLALTMMYAAGVPISNAKRDLEAATLTAAEATNNPDVMLWFMKQKYQVNDKTKSLWISAYFDAQDKGNEGLARNIKQYMLDSGGVTEKDIEKKRQKRLKDNPTEEATQKLDKSMKTLEGSAIWKDAKEDDKTYYSGVLEKISVGIEDTQTGYVTNKAMSGLTNEEVILYKLALKKVDKPNKNGNLGTYTNDEKEEAIKLLAKNYKLTEEQKKILKG